MLPVDVYHLIAEQSPNAYRAMLALPPFARDLDVGKRLNYMILFGHGVKITAWSIIWTKNSIWHRVGGPAVEHIDGSREWYVNGHRHRIDGPAVERMSGFREWYVNNKLHKLDGPAIENDDGSREWYVNGQRHRLDGPAIKYADGSGVWYVNGIKIG